MPPASKRKTKASAAPARAALSKIFEENDVLQLVLAYLSAEQLCLCSMVCSRLKFAVDDSLVLQQQFAYNLRWWGAPASYDSPTNHLLTFNEAKSHYYHEVTHTESARQMLWQLNIRAVINMRVCMRMDLFLPLDNGVSLHGDPDRVRKMQARKRASIDVLQWKVTRVAYTHSRPMSFLGPLGAITLCASEFTCNDPRVQLSIKYPVIVTFNDVPVGDVSYQLSYRRLWVMRGVRHCMHCHERPPAFQSCDAGAADHNVLCKHCLDLLYVREEQLPRRWHIRRLSVLGVPRAHFVQHSNHALNFAAPAVPLRHILKSNIARLLGHDSWISFIKDNHRFSLKKSKCRSRFNFSPRWF